MLIALKDATEVSTAGGKAASLGRMLRAGFTVPEGFVLPATLFERFLDASGRRADIERICATVDPASFEATLQASLQVTSWLQDTELDTDLCREVKARTRDLGASVAVRSSAIGEDSATASFAGQLDSFLDIRDEAALLQAVKDCWCSFYSARGLAYQAATGVGLAGMAVIVQSQIEGAVSGVAFTEAPQSPEQLLIEYCEGGCEQLVSGEVDPLSLLADRGHWRLGDDLELLAAEQVEELIATFLGLERTFGGPQDIEWTINPAGKLHILQSRPITTRRTGDRVVYSNANINENYPGPVTPFLQSVAQTSYAHYFRNLAIAYGFAPRRIEAMEDALQNIVGVHGQRLYYDVSNIHAVFRMAPFGNVFARWFNDFVGVEDNTDARTQDVTWRRGTDNPVTEALELAKIAAHVVQTYRGITPRVERFERTMTAYAAKSSPEQLRALSRDELVDLVAEFIHIRSHEWLGGTLADSACMVCCGALEAFLARAFDGDSKVLLHSLLRGLPDIVSSEPPKQLWKLSRVIRDDEALMELFEHDTDHVLDVLGWNGESMTADHPFSSPLQQFLDDWGFRCTGELMMTTTSFQEEPQAVVDMLRSYKDMTDSGPDEAIEQQAALRLEQTAQMSAELDPIAGKVFETLLNATGRSLSLRERARLKQAQLYRCCRRAVLALGAELTRLGELDEPEDVLFLRWQEIVALREGGEVPRDTVATRKARFAEESTWPEPPPRIVMNRGESWTPTSKAVEPAELPDDSEELRGLAAAAGKVTARATVALGQQDFHLVKSGDVLVAPQTDPGWATVLFLVRGLVMERGGMLSHGAIIAREFGIPSVVGVPRATERIPQAATVLVDGDAGVVHVCD